MLWTQWKHVCKYYLSLVIYVMDPVKTCVQILFVISYLVMDPVKTCVQILFVISYLCYGPSENMCANIICH